MKIRLSLHRTAWFSYYFWLECGRKQLALGPRVDSGGFRQCWRGTGGGWCNCSLPSRTVASFCPACFRGTKREVVLGEGQMQLGQEGVTEGVSHRVPSQSSSPPLHEELVNVFSVCPAALRSGNPAVLHLAFGEAFMYLV